VSQSLGPARPPVDIAPPSPGSREARASLTFKVLAGINVVGLALAALPGGAPAASLYTAVSILATAVVTALYLAEAIGLDRHRPWAIAVARPMLVLVGLIGLIWMFVALGADRFRAPYEAVFAVWAWRGPAEHPVTPRLGRRSLGLLGATTALVVVALTGPLVFGWGGFLDVHHDDLRGAVSATCSASGSDLPDVITVTYDWSWAAASPFPSGLDMVVIGWSGFDALQRPLYLLDTTPTPSVGVYPGRAGAPSFEMATAIASESSGSWRWGIELAEQRLGPGRIELVMRRAREGPPHPGPLTIRATYVHAGLWRSDTSVTCAWS
jgi:hypothetical protein